MKIVAAPSLCFVFSLLGIHSISHDRDDSCSVDILDPPVCSVDSLDPSGEKPVGESALLQQVTVQMRKPFEPDDNLPKSTMVLELVEKHSAVNKGPPTTSQKTAPVSSSPTSQNVNQPAANFSVVPRRGNRDAAHSLLETDKDEIQAARTRSNSNKTNTTESLSLQVFAGRKGEHQEPEATRSKVLKSGGEPGLQTMTRLSHDRWLDMLHVGKNIQRGKGFISFETILLFCAMSVVVGVLIWGVVCLWSYSSGSHAHHEDADKAAKISSGRPSADRPVYAQRSPTMQQGSAGSTQHQEQPPGSSRLSAYPPANPSPRPLPRKEAYKPADVPAEVGSGQMSSMRALCPELIVPRGSECILVVRYLPPGQKDQVEFDILDINGEPVLKVEVVPVAMQGSTRQNTKQMVSQRSKSPTIVLKSLQPRETTGGFVFAYCRIITKDDDSGAKQQNVYIYKEDDELYAHLMKDDVRKRYVLTSGHHGLQLLFEGNFEEHVVNVTNESGERVAATEPRVMHFDPTKFYKLRVAANSDVGLVLCGLLMISQMEFRS